ncbi:hypothetical protein V1639_13500 [Pseudarthrobacter sp. J75]|uniref:hypothetical protein n=1 Tax=unclassified Pseudarthrobacter TaxID=2647000 RepID=UPI002E7FDB54|nr:MULTISPECIES: hypothetical protein [unclassified Pseudarthrobacter]MEE2523645.1 hypothetical protein [Pseudarthrobacter sp. J47]MEE2530035.1 hypothetical protein [Pseudarthrobacter sp. J75]
MSANEVDLLKWPDPLPESWQAAEVPNDDAGTSRRYQVTNGGVPAGTVLVEFVVATAVAETYPVSARDRLLTPDADAGPEALQLVSERVMAADPGCRRLVLAVDEGDLNAIARGEAAGYRFVVDVDIPGRSLSLLAAEPDWVLETSRYMDDVPTS